MPESIVTAPPDPRNKKSDTRWRYRKVFPKLWRHPRFMALESGDKLLCVYLLSGPQTNRLGYYAFSPGQAAEDLGLAYDTMATRLERICAAFDWRYDSELRVVFVPSWFEWNPPDGPKVMAGAAKDAIEVPQGALYPTFYASIAAVCKSLNMAVPDTLVRPFDVDPMGYPSLYPMPYPIGKGTPFQGTGNREKDIAAHAAGVVKNTTPKKDADPRVPAFLKWYAAESESISHVPYVVEWPRDSAIVKAMLKARGDNERVLRELAWTFLHLADDWHDKIGRTIPSLKRQANVLAERRSKALYAAGVSDFTDAMLGLEPTT